MEHEPMDTDGPPTTPTAAKSNKKEERDARRASENRARARVARWRSLVKRLIYNHVWIAAASRDPPTSAPATRACSCMYAVGPE